jgi:hypothetical protein
MLLSISIFYFNFNISGEPKLYQYVISSKKVGILAVVLLKVQIN